MAEFLHQYTHWSYQVLGPLGPSEILNPEYCCVGYGLLGIREEVLPYTPNLGAGIAWDS